MTQIRERTVMFADLRGSTGLFENLGNAQATSVVTQTVRLISESVLECSGQIIKTLGDGVMASFAAPRQALKAAEKMHAALERVVLKDSHLGARQGVRNLHLQVAIARGEVVEMNGDCFGDAVNVAARLLDHAGDNETLVTGEVHAGLTLASQRQFRNLDRIVLRGRIEPTIVHVLDTGSRAGEYPSTQFGEVISSTDPGGIRLVWLDIDKVFGPLAMPVVLGRSPQATYNINDVRVSRSHARIDWHGGSFSLTDLSYNGTYVRFAGGDEVVSLRRGTCTLHGNGSIGLGSQPSDLTAPAVRFEVQHVADSTARLPHL